MSGIENLLADILRSEPAEGAVTKQASAEQTLDVAGFVTQLSKTASALDKVAESLPSSPQLLAKQLKMLDNPLSVTRADIHDQHREFAGQVLPASSRSLRVPSGIDQIQKQASADQPGQFMRNWLRR